MLIEQERAAKLVKGRLNGILFDKQKQEEFLDYANGKFGMMRGDAMDYVTQRMDLSGATPFTLFIIATSVDHVGHTHITETIFTPDEIQRFSNDEIEYEEIKFPLRIKCVPVSPDQWIGAVDVQFLMRLRDAQLITYNDNAQRTMTKRVRRGNSTYVITVNESAVKQIMSAFQNGFYIPNTITLNLHQDETDYTYNESAGELVIYSLQNNFDISDGFHRFVALSRIHEGNHDFNYPLELRITKFSNERVKQFIYQEDQKTKMSKRDSDSMNMNFPPNVLTERLNSDIYFNWHGQISRNDGLVNFGDFAECVNYFMFKPEIQKGHRSAAAAARFITNYQGIIRDKLNPIIENVPELLKGNVSFIQLMIMFYCIVTYEDNEAILKHVQNGFANICNIDTKVFNNRTVRIGLVNIIKTIV